MKFLKIIFLKLALTIGILNKEVKLSIPQAYANSRLNLQKKLRQLSYGKWGKNYFNKVRSK